MFFFVLLFHRDETKQTHVCIFAHSCSSSLTRMQACKPILFRHDQLPYRSERSTTFVLSCQGCVRWFIFNREHIFAFFSFSFSYSRMSIAWRNIHICTKCNMKVIAVKLELSKQLRQDYLTASQLSLVCINIIHTCCSSSFISLTTILHSSSTIASSQLQHRHTRSRWATYYCKASWVVHLLIEKTTRSTCSLLLWASEPTCDTSVAK